MMKTIRIFTVLSFMFIVSRRYCFNCNDEITPLRDCNSVMTDKANHPQIWVAYSPNLWQTTKHARTH